MLVITITTVPPLHSQQAISLQPPEPSPSSHYTFHSMFLQASRSCSVNFVKKKKKKKKVAHIRGCPNGFCTRKYVCTFCSSFSQPNKIVILNLILDWLWSAGHIPPLFSSFCTSEDIETSSMILFWVSVYWSIGVVCVKEIKEGNGRWPFIHIWGCSGFWGGV